MYKNLKTIPVILSLLALFNVTLINITIGQEDQVALPEDPLKGRLVFEQKGCIRCHSIYGYGGDGASDLGEQQFLGSFLDLASILWNHSPKMSRKMRQVQVSRPQFSRQEMAELIAYLYYLPYLGEPGDASKGKELFSKKGCITCHSAGGKGGTAAPGLDKLKIYLSPLYMAEAMWNHGPAMDELMKKMKAKRPWLSGQEIVDLSAYVRKISQGAARKKVYMSPGNPRAGKTVFEQKGCIQCHAVNGQGGDSAPDLIASELKKGVSEIAGILWNHGSDMWVRMREKGLIQPKFTSKEMADLIAYLYFTSFAARPGDPDKGEKVFSEKGCSSCHATSEQAELIGPDLFESRKITSPIAMVQIMWNHAPIMKTRMLEKDLPWPEFKPHEMADLFAYLQSIVDKTH